MTAFELSFNGYTLGYFPTEAEAVREWAKEGEISTFDPSTNKYYYFTNK